MRFELPDFVVESSRIGGQRGICSDDALFPRSGGKFASCRGQVNAPKSRRERRRASEPEVGSMLPAPRSQLTHEQSENVQDDPPLH